MNQTPKLVVSDDSQQAHVEFPDGSKIEPFNNKTIGYIMIAQSERNGKLTNDESDRLRAELKSSNLKAELFPPEAVRALVELLDEQGLVIHFNPGEIDVNNSGPDAGKKTPD